MKPPQYFDFHRRIGLRVDTQDEWARDYFLSEYRFAAGQSNLASALVELKFRYSKLPSSPGSGYRYRSHKLLARWYYQIEIDRHRIGIDAVGNRASIPMIHHMLVHPAIRQLSSQCELLLLHAAALTLAERSVLITGPGGTGKTTTSSLMLASPESDWGLQGDDYVFVSPNGRTLSYRTRAHLYQDLLRFVPRIVEKLSMQERLHLQVFGLIRQLSKDRIKWPLRVELQRLWPQRPAPTEATLSGLFFLRRVPGRQLSIMPAQDRKVAAEQLLQMNFSEANYYLQLLHGAFDTGEQKRWRQAESNLIQRMLGKVPVYWLGLPERAIASTELAETLAALIAANRVPVGG